MKYRRSRGLVDLLGFRRGSRLPDPALQDISLKIGTGEHTAFLGPNGAGKTTLLKLIGGVLYPSSGMVKVSGYDTVRDNQRVRDKVGFVINEERSFFWRLSGRQNLRFFGSMDSISGRQLKDRTEELLEMVGLTGRADKKLAEYSCGMRQRLSIARGLLRSPEILVLDEPTRALDPAGADSIRSLIIRIAEGKRTTVLVATHQFEEAEGICENYCIITEGKTLGVWSKEQIRATGFSMKEFYLRRTSADVSE